MTETTSHYGLWSLVIINSVIFISKDVISKYAPYFNSWHMMRRYANEAYMR